jgi:hypothetical protein
MLWPNTTLAKKNQNSDANTNIFNNVATQFKTHKNNVGRVSMTEFVPLSVSIPENSNINYIGVSFLTQKGATPSTGVGAAFNF